MKQTFIKAPVEPSAGMIDKAGTHQHHPIPQIGLGRAYQEMLSDQPRFKVVPNINQILCLAASKCIKDSCGDENDKLLEGISKYLTQNGYTIIKEVNND